MRSDALRFVRVAHRLACAPAQATLIHVEASFIKGHTVDVANDEALLERLREGSEAMIVSSARVLNNQTGRLRPSAFTSSSE